MTPAAAVTRPGYSDGDRNAHAVADTRAGGGQADRGVVAAHARGLPVRLGGVGLRSVAGGRLRRDNSARKARSARAESPQFGHGQNTVAQSTVYLYSGDATAQSSSLRSPPEHTHVHRG